MLATNNGHKPRTPREQRERSLRRNRSRSTAVGLEVGGGETPRKEPTLNWWGVGEGVRGGNPTAVPQQKKKHSQRKVLWPLRVQFCVQGKGKRSWQKRETRTSQNLPIRARLQRKKRKVHVELPLGRWPQKKKPRREEKGSPLSPDE